MASVSFGDEGLTAKHAEQEMKTENHDRPDTPTFHINVHTTVEFLHTMWLFVKSDFATLAIPETLFGVFGALSGSLLTTNGSPTLGGVFFRGLRALLYVLSSLFVADLANQGQTDSAKEDSVNKPWRPIPAGRITVDQTRRLLLHALPLVLGFNFLLGCWRETALLFPMIWMYNDLGGGEDSLIWRNALNSAAYGLFHAGSLRVATGLDYAITPDGYKWIAIISSVILTTMHMQDVKDQVGDAARGRRTVSLVLGDQVARWTIAVPVALWSLACPYFLAAGFLGYLITCSVGGLIVLRILVLKGEGHDRATWQLWTAWTALLYLMPLLARSGIA